jgi:hypothetical protein
MAVNNNSLAARDYSWHRGGQEWQHSPYSLRRLLVRCPFKEVGAAVVRSLPLPNFGGARWSGLASGQPFDAACSTSH